MSKAKRKPGDWGTAQQAIDWALDISPDGEVEAGAFLRCWRMGDLDEWPDFVKWLNRSRRPRTSGRSALRAEDGGGHG